VRGASRAARGAASVVPVSLSEGGGLADLRGGPPCQERVDEASARGPPD
jgi:hypothetical protein